MADGATADKERSERADALIARMKKARGYIYPEWEFAAREFIAIALLGFRGGEKAALVAHMERAMRFGATREELFEVLETCMVPGGAPTFHRGLSALLDLK
jgi:alkylhydroperoxidase/carboxymuconolactone decarboxylase family protein YurZ